MSVYIDSVQIGTVEVTGAVTVPTVTAVDFSSMFTLIGIVLMMIVEISLIKAIKKR